jgi:hypothetical protein
MSTPKLCVSLNWQIPDSINNLNPIKDIINLFIGTRVDYFSLDIERVNFTTNLCDDFDNYCREKEVSWFPLVTSISSIDLTRPYYSKLPNGKLGYMTGIPSGHIKSAPLLNYARECSDYLILYTGKATQREIDRAIELSQPDLVMHHSYGEIKIDYIKYLQAISIEFEKKYITGFKNNYLDDISLILAANLLDAKFLEFTYDISDLDKLGETSQYYQLVNSLERLNSSRGGYCARKLSTAEKELLTR